MLNVTLFLLSRAEEDTLRENKNLFDNPLFNILECISFYSRAADVSLPLHRSEKGELLL